MLEHQMKILTEVSFDKYLFRNELIKSFKWLNNAELLKLRNWLIQNFKQLYIEFMGEIPFQKRFNRIG